MPMPSVLERSNADTMSAPLWLIKPIDPSPSVSVTSARTVAAGLEESGHTVVPLGIAEDGCWVTREESLAALDGAVDALVGRGQPVAATLRRLLDSDPEVVFPLVHGTWGEDGTLQGLVGRSAVVHSQLANLFERELGVTVERLGKPHAPIFELAMERVRAVAKTPDPRILVVDDSVESGIRGGAALGFDTLLVLSGRHRSRDEAEGAMATVGVRATYILDSVVA